jgi:hypothetical protein
VPFKAIRALAAKPGGSVALKEFVSDDAEALDYYPDQVGGRRGCMGETCS